MPEHALLEVTFTPETKQDLYTTVFSNDGGRATRDGFQFQHLAMDRYRLASGGDRNGPFRKNCCCRREGRCHSALNSTGSWSRSFATAPSAMKCGSQNACWSPLVRSP